MTLNECFEKMGKLWWFLCCNPSKGKQEAYRALGLGHDKCYCPCCEYAFQEADGDIEIMFAFCPLKDFWPKNQICTDEGSAYKKWNDTEDEEIRANAAAEICCAVNMESSKIKS